MPEKKVLSARFQASFLMDNILSEKRLLADLNLRPSGTRAIAWAILGNGAGMKGGSYKNFQSLQFVRCDCRDAGAAAFAEVLRIGPTLDVMIKTLSFVHCNVFSLGCHMLGNALASGMKTISPFPPWMHYQG